MDSLLWRVDDANYFQYVADDKIKQPLYFITITSRKRHMSKHEFKSRLENMLMITNYPSNLKGYIEHSERTGYHFHGITSWKYNHFAKKSGWFSLVKEITSNNVYSYICKERSTELL